MVNPDNWNFVEDNNINNDKDENDNNGSSEYLGDTKVIKDVTIESTMCLGDDCSVSIDWVYYAFKAKDFEFFEILNDYKEYLIIDIYYVKEKTDFTFTTSDYSIVDYKIYLKKTNEEITNVKTEEELRKKLGFYNEGENTGVFELSESVGTGVGYNDDDTSYTFSRYILIDLNNIEYIMDFVYNDYTEIPNNLIVGNKYNVTFEVKKDEFGYDYFIKSIK